MHDDVRLGADHGLPDGDAIERIDDRHICAGAAYRLGLTGRAGEAQDGVACGDEQRDETASHRAGRAGYENAHVLAVVMASDAGCCARAQSGHAAAPPRSVMNSRRLMLDMGTSSPVGWRLRHRGRQAMARSVCRMLNLPQNGRRAPWARPESF
jgi:hypothetical protein